MRRVAVCTVALLLGACGGAERVTIAEISREPESFDVADRVLVRGYALGDGRGSVLLCSELSGDRPPNADGPCIEAEGVPLSDAGGDHHLDGVWWSERRDLDCLVVRGMPTHARPERLVVSCVREGTRP
ncbi:MAG TPA: hypothetical protein VG318_02405 [Actinomycetota bacterium]|nr:hypothetical protein [Actinomycetota bacterium]